MTVSLTSYNLYQFLFLILLVVSLSSISDLDTNKLSINLSSRQFYFYKTFGTIIVFSIVAFQFFVFFNYSFIKNLNKISVPITYEELKHQKTWLTNDKDILFKLSLDNFNANNYQEAIQFAMKSGQVAESINANLLLGQSFLFLKNYSQAEVYLIKGSKIHPGRFKPKYYLFNFYLELGDLEKLKEVSLDIINTPVKVDSEEIRELRRRAMDKIQELNHNL